MSYNSHISGVIEGITEESYLLIKEELEHVFDDINWYPEELVEIKDRSGEIKKSITNKGGAIEIYSYGKHYDEKIFPVYDKIAFCIDADGKGGLDYEGDESGDIGSIFFITRQWKEVWTTIQFPQNPFIQPKEEVNKDKSFDKLFPITSISREDIIHAFAESDILEQVKERVKKMDDSDMINLASKLADDYCEQLFWDSLRTLFEDRFLDK